MTQLLVARNRRPENVVLHVVAVQKIHRRSGQNHCGVRLEQKGFLIHNKMLGRRRECLSRDGVDVDHCRALPAADLAAEGAAMRGDGGCNNKIEMPWL